MRFLLVMSIDRTQLKTRNLVIYVIDFKMLICGTCKEHKDTHNISWDILYGSSREKSCQKLPLLLLDGTKLEMTQKSKVIMLLSFKTYLWAFMR